MMRLGSIICLVLAGVFTLLSVATYGSVLLVLCGLAALIGAWILEARPGRKKDGPA